MFGYLTTSTYHWMLGDWYCPVSAACTAIGEIAHAEIDHGLLLNTALKRSVP